MFIGATVFLGVDGRENRYRHRVSHRRGSTLPTHQERRYNDNNQWDAVKTGGLWDTSPFAYNGLEQATTFNGTGSLGYHALGNLDAVGVQWAAGYRGDGLRMWKDEGAVRTYFLYGGEQLLAETNASGTYTAVNLWGADGLYGRVLNPEDPNTRTVVYYLGDVQGTIAQQVDASRQVVATAAYDAWGRPLTAGTAPYGYKGQWGYYTDADTGYILCTYRYYVPEAGRWLTRDPIGYAGGINLYAYCGNDPVNKVDPRGHWGQDVHFGKTREWGLALGISASNIDIIATANINVDGTRAHWRSKNPLTNQKWHFDRNPDPAIDSRVENAEMALQNAIANWKWGDYLYAYYINLASKCGYVPLKNQLIIRAEMSRALSRAEALRLIGIGLHALQDIEAHMDAGVGKSYAWNENWPIADPNVPKTFPAVHVDECDNPGLDYVGGKFVPGHNRIYQTFLRTKGYLQRFNAGIGGGLF